MKKALSIALALFLQQASGYSNPNPSGCGGEAICESLIDGAEYGEVDGNGTILSCNFGVTNVGNTKKCDVPCDTDITYNCTCVSQSVATTGLTEEAQFSLMFAVICFVALLLVAVAHYLRVRNYRKRVTHYLFELETKEKSKVQVLEPSPPTMCYFYLLYILLLVGGSIFASEAAGIRGRDFWTGCGE